MIASPFVLVLRRANTSQSHHQAVETKALSFMSAHHQQQNHNKTPRSLSIKKEVNITYSTQLVLISLYNGHYYYYHYLWHGVNGTNIDGTYFNLLILVIIIIAVIVHYYCYSAGFLAAAANLQRTSPLSASYTRFHGSPNQWTHYDSLCKRVSNPNCHHNSVSAFVIWCHVTWGHVF